VIWTTTPWTLVSNLAVALHPEFDYVAVEVGGSDVLILAEALLAQSLQKFGITGHRVVEKFKGKMLEGLKARHPFIDRDSLVILGLHVTLEAGTGIVHTAPGHGQEDYEAGLRYGLEVYAPVDHKARFTKEAGQFAGTHVHKANGGIIELLKEKNALLAEEKISHSYPHCWRCKHPVIFRATEQWFISMEKNDLLKKTVENVHAVAGRPRGARTGSFPWWSTGLTGASRASGHGAYPSWRLPARTAANCSWNNRLSNRWPRSWKKKAPMSGSSSPRRS